MYATFYYLHIIKQKELKNKIMNIEQLKKELADLPSALKAGLITTNEYQDLYYSISQRIKKLS